MVHVGKWATSARFPVTETIKQQVFTDATRKGTLQSNIVSDQLCTDILQRLSPYLRRNQPVDILDLWPGAGLWSSKVNEFLRPRHHVLVEPDMTAYGPMLKDLARHNPCYKLVSTDIYTMNKWDELLERYFPEQTAQHVSRGQKAGSLLRNDTLLVLANPSTATSKKDHYTPARWWSAIMGDCMTQTGFHGYGSVRILASFPFTEIQSVLPRSVGERKRPAFMTEVSALRAMEVASTYDHEPWPTMKGWGPLTDCVSRVADRAAADNIVTPPGREAPPLLPAPENPQHAKGRSKIPYQPRVRTETHDRLAKTLEGCDRSKKDTPDAVEKQVRLAIAALNADNKIHYIRACVVKKHLEIDERGRDLSRAAANPSMSVDELRKIDEEIATMTAALADEMTTIHYRPLRGYERMVDDERATALSNNFDDSVLLWDRRPFEPLRIDTQEFYPRVPRSVLYFEPNETPVAMRELKEVPEEKRKELLQLFDMVTLIFSTRNNMTVAELASAIFPRRSANELVRSIPSLALVAQKRLKPGCGPLPLEDPTADPNTCFQENLDYDLSQVRLRFVPASTIWDLLLEYQRHSLDLSALQFSRMLGGTLTTFRSGEFLLNKKRLH
ncbi:uncharacterized protein N7459_000364 [Penicillium hispanicum]|uniref:uncharacterized protein n=1 Tax=Penicillium hispanicum TaxID=1080232 RepID=UPI0025407DF9|nr:uncharacterized protein N7459_000364 [Penicillium hispanicum]KAJ5594156.1 hypothetical protein N7459_000364 [Penicillium hispanicum]